MSTPSINEVWYAKLPGKSTIATVKVVELTEATVCVEDQASTLAQFGLTIPDLPTRYETKSVKWVERLTN